MKRPSKTQISLMNTLESIIQSGYFDYLMNQEIVPPSIHLQSLKTLESGTNVQRVKLDAPPIDDFNLEEKELLFLITHKLTNLDYPSDLLIINTTKDDFLNLLAYVIRQTRFF